MADGNITLVRGVGRGKPDAGDLANEINFCGPQRRAASAQ